MFLIGKFFFQFFLFLSIKNSCCANSLPKCPGRCFCTEDGRHANCQNAGLERMPAAEEFDERVEILDLRWNKLVHAELNRLAGLANLHTLMLGQNGIRHLEKHSLGHLPKLRRLHVGRNQIRSLPTLAPQNGHSHLQLLDVHANQIRHLSANSLDHLNHLKHLNLAHNFLQTLPNKLFHGKEQHLNKIELQGNPWNCDCRILHLAEFLQKEAEEMNGKARCMNPGTLRHRPIVSLCEEEAKCFWWGPLLEVKIEGKIMLKCTPDYETEKLHNWTMENVQWIFKDENLVEGMLESKLLDDGRILIAKKIFEENYPELRDDLKCAINYPQSASRQSRNAIPLTAAENSNGVNAIFGPIHHHHQQRQQRRSQRIRVVGKQQNERTREMEREIVEDRGHQHRPHSQPAQPTNWPPSSQQFLGGNSAPRFTYTPRDRRYREGTSVTLNCEAAGQPKPRINWFFNGRQIEASRKHEIRQNGTQLVIYPFLEHDVGGYSCEAENFHGRVRSEQAQLELIRSVPPVILEGPKSLMAKPGQRVTFRCKSRGEPKPSIGWFYNGVEIAELGGHFQVSEDGTELNIGQVTRQDGGTYSCMAGNAVGSMTADAKLEVQSSQLDELDRQLSGQTLRDIVTQASQNIEKAIAKTKEELKAGVNSPQDLLRHFKFIGKQPTELTRAREIYEESLRLVEKHVELGWLIIGKCKKIWNYFFGLRLRPEEMPAQNISFESVLSVTHIQTLMELSGCMNGQFKDSCQDMCFHTKYRSYTGQCNNFEHRTWGVSQMPFLRLLPPIYENGFNTPVGWDPQRLYFGFPKPNPRTVSMELIGTEVVSPHPLYSSMLMQWGQFLDHDLDFTATALSRQTYMGGARCNRTCENVDPCFNIPLPPNDPRRRSMGQGGDKLPCIEFERSAAICGSGETSPIFRQITYREQVNIITSYLDGSQIYGSTEVDAIDLRDLFSDHGLLRFDIVSASQKPYLPFERDSAMDCRRNFSQENPIRCFLSGDFRANEQVGLTAMHTIWLREHNRIATTLLEMNPDWDGERIYQETRKIIGAMLQHITYNEWLPKVLGQDGFQHLIGPYTGYSSEVNPTISQAFATAAFRFGHTLINPILVRLDREFEPIPEGPLPLYEAFFAPERLLAEGGVDPLLRGLFATPLKQPMSEQLLNMELTEKLFHRAHNVSLDLAAINIQRGRDHGVPGYLEYRRFCNLTVPQNWAELSVEIPNSQILARLRNLYGHPANIDLWVGGIVEKRLPDGLVGPTFSCIIGDQFKRLRDGDRFWYENAGVFSPLQLAQIKKSTLASVICRNGDEIDRIQPDVFLYVGQHNKLAYKKCEDLGQPNLRMWMSCCDENCPTRAAVGGEKAEEGEKQRRKKRSQHFYTAKKGI